MGQVHYQISAQWLSGKDGRVSERNAIQRNESDLNVPVNTL